jgi:hypothetical protein
MFPFVLLLAFQSIKLNAAVESMALLIRIRDALCSNIEPVSGYPDRGFFQSFFHTNTGTVSLKGSEDGVLQ